MEHLPGRSGVGGGSFNISSLRNLSCPVVSPKPFLLQPNPSRTPPLSPAVRSPTNSGASEATPLPFRFRFLSSQSALQPGSGPAGSRFRVRCPGSRSRLVSRAGPAARSTSRVSGLRGPAPAAPSPPARAVLAAPWSPSVTIPCISRRCRCRRARSWRGTRAGTGRCPGATISTWGRLSASCWCCAAGEERGPAPGAARAWGPEGPGQNYQRPWLPWPLSAPEAGRPGAVAPQTRIPNPQGAGILAVGRCFEAAAPSSPTARALLPQGERPR